MISCPTCNSKLAILRHKLPVKRSASDTQYVYQICWVAKLDIKCPSCSAMIPSSYLQDLLPEDVIISEGARAMSIRNKKRFNSKTGPKAANKRWNPPEVVPADEID